MQFSDLELYEVVEAKDCLVIFKRGTRLGGMQATPLAAGPMPVVCEYITRYTEGRTAGKTPEDAHNDALVGARVIDKGMLDRPTVAQARKRWPHG